MDLNRRETQRQSILRTAGFIELPEFQQIGLVQLRTRLTALNDTYDRFIQEHQNVVESIVDDDGMNQQNEYLAQVEESYCN